jgi:hypothetical protein
MRSQYSALMQYLTNLWLSSEACDAPVEGCSEAEIAEIMHAQSVERLPLMYVEFLSHMGRKTGGLEWYFGSEITYPSVCEFKPMTFKVLRQSKIFVLTHDYQGDCAIYFHITDDDDPMLYWVGYDYRPDLNQFDILETKALGQLSDYLNDFIGNVIEEHQHLKNLIARGDS